MFDKYMISSDNLKNVKVGNIFTGFQIGVRITYYRGIALSIIDGFTVTVDGENFETDSMTFTVKNREYTFWAKEAFDYTYCDPQLLADYIPYIMHIHGKVYEMTFHCEEPSIPYADIVPVLVKNNWSGYISTEYEGQRHYHDIPDMDIDSVEQVRRHHVMLKRLLDE